MKVIDLLNKIANGEEVPKHIRIDEHIYHFDCSDSDYYNDIENAPSLLERIWRHNAYVWLNLEVEILDEEKIEIPQEFLKDVNPESEIVLIQSNLGHDFGYRNSVGFITSRSSMGDCFVLAFDRIENRWWECRFDKDEYLRTGLFVSDLFKPFVTLTPSKEDEFIDIEEITIRDNTIGFPNGEWTARNMDKALSIKINDLIKNQKKIIERLDKNE